MAISSPDKQIQRRPQPIPGNLPDPRRLTLPTRHNQKHHVRKYSISQKYPILSNIDFRQAIEGVSLTGLYSGIFTRILFNLPFAGALYATANGSDNASMFWLATLVAYPLNTLKVSAQVAGTPIASYRGVVPFILANYFCAWELNALTGQAKLGQLKQEARRKLKGE